MRAGWRSCTARSTATWRSRAGGWREPRACWRTSDECAGHGWLALDRAPFTDDVAERERLAAAALAIARRFGDVDLEYDALALLGESYVAAGRVAEGMHLIDEAMTAVSAGEVIGIVAVGDIYCRLLSACEMRSMSPGPSSGCRWPGVRRGTTSCPPSVAPTTAGILIAIGRWPEAEEELLAAINTFESSYRAMRSSPLVKLADLRVRQGRLDEAQRLLEGNESHPVARRALATIALTRGEVALAEDLVDSASTARPLPDPACAPALELLVQIRVARDDVPRRRRCPSGSLDSQPGPATARRRLRRARRPAGSAAAERREAPTHLQAALRGFTDARLPARAARAQLELARTIAEPAPEAAVAEARSHSGGSSGSERRRRRRGGWPAAPAGRERARVAEAVRGADEARDGSAVPAGRRMLQRGDRRAPVHQPAHG